MLIFEVIEEFVRLMNNGKSHTIFKCGFLLQINIALVAQNLLFQVIKALSSKICSCCA